MLKRITIGVLVTMMILAVGCGKSSESVKSDDASAPEHVHVDFKVTADDAELSALLNDLGSPVLVTCYSVNLYLYISVPAGKTATQAIDTLKASPLVEYVKPSCRTDEIVVGFNVSCDRESASSLLETLGSCITWDPEWGYSAVLTVTQGETVDDMVDILNSSLLVQFAEPCYFSADCDPAF
jgi:hypothetical protein